MVELYVNKILEIFKTKIIYVISDDAIFHRGHSFYYSVGFIKEMLSVLQD